MEYSHDSKVNAETNTLMRGIQFGISWLIISLKFGFNSWVAISSTTFEFSSVIRWSLHMLLKKKKQFHTGIPIPNCPIFMLSVATKHSSKADVYWDGSEHQVPQILTNSSLK